MFSLLDERERRVLSLRFGLDRGEPRTLEEVGELSTSAGSASARSRLAALSRLRHPSADVDEHTAVAG